MKQLYWKTCAPSYSTWQAPVGMRVRSGLHGTFYDHCISMGFPAGRQTTEHMSPTHTQLPQNRCRFPGNAPAPTFSSLKVWLVTNRLLRYFSMHGVNYCSIWFTLAQPLNSLYIPGKPYILEPSLASCGEPLRTEFAGSIRHGAEFYHRGPGMMGLWSWALYISLLSLSLFTCNGAWGSCLSGSQEWAQIQWGSSYSAGWMEPPSSHNAPALPHHHLLCDSAV
jgi:hypothetical protein